MPDMSNTPAPSATSSKFTPTSLSAITPNLQRLPDEVEAPSIFNNTSWEELELEEGEIELTPDERGHGRLSSQHIAYLSSRAILPWVAYNRGYESFELKQASHFVLGGLSKAQAAYFKRAKSKKGTPLEGLLIPMFAFEEWSGYRVCLTQVRPDVAREVQEASVDSAGKSFETKRTVKFEAPAYASPNPEEGGVRERLRRGGERGQLPADIHPLVPFDDVMNVDAPLIFVEGIPKSDALLSAILTEGLVAVPVGLTGVTMGYHAADTEENPTSAPQLVQETVKQLLLADRTIFLCWDADWRTNGAVARSLVTFGGLLENEGANVFVVDIDPAHGPKAGVDDYLAQATASSLTPLSDLLVQRTISLDEARLVAKVYPADDAGRAERLADNIIASADFRYNESLETWMAWNGRSWEACSHRPLARLAQDLANRDAGLDFAKARSRASISAAVELAVTHPGVTVRDADYDSDPYSLNTPEGVVDLRTGDLKPIRRDSFHRLMAGTAPDHLVQTPTWASFLSETFLGDDDTIRFLKRFVGMAAIGKKFHEGVLICHGGGRNGKSTLWNVFFDVFGSYAHQMDPRVLLGKDTDEKRVHFKGKRLVLGSETGRGEKLDLVSLKLLTSDEPMTARALYQNSVTFRPTHNMVLSTNHVPTLSETDEGTWRRITLLPFRNDVSEGVQDERLKEKLAAEYPGILRWVVDGAMEYLEHGLHPSSMMAEATRELRAKSDLVGRFLLERCVVNANLPKLRVRRSEFYAAFRDFCSDLGKHPWGLDSVIETLQTKNVIDRDKPFVVIQGHPTIKGIGLKYTT